MNLDCINDVDFFTQKINGRYRNINRRLIAFKIFIFGLLALTLSCVSALIYSGIYERKFSYSNNLNKTVNIIPNKEIYFYIGTDLNQARLNFSKSINYDQLKGESRDLDLSRTKPLDQRNGKDYYPAGKLPASFFQDSIKIDGIDLPEGDITFEDEKRIIGFTDYKRDEINLPPGWSSKTNKNTTPLNFSPERFSTLPILNTRFINWINIGSFVDSRKLWGKFISPSNKINISIKGVNNSYFKKRNILLTDGSILGLKNYIYSAILFFISLLAFIIAFVVLNQII
ncbi:hypothetical protein A0H76_2803 [Hepatospora eriocheir]|uniref:CDC50 n=1 Tax=Hepatospora eriocheir TaxID=1081669 RepID=A0A1X0QJD8_9MICR|nr:hypothetical protein A0H76_2803 [Hepatospora eriocheir]